MKKLLEDPDKYYDPKKRPSGHDIGKSFGKNNNGAIPSNLLQIPNSESNGGYLSAAKILVSKVILQDSLQSYLSFYKIFDRTRRYRC
nr:hypothetical protein [Saccharobesus litoralis]